jgi:hypothetical protein
MDRTNERSRRQGRCTMSDEQKPMAWMMNKRGDQNDNSSSND